MLYSSHHSQLISAASGFKSRVAAWDVCLKLVCVIATIACSDRALATDPPPAPRSATPFVRPTQYHLLPPIYRPQVDRVPTVDDLVPMLDDSIHLRPSSGPVHGSTATTGFQSSDDWPYTEASHGRRRIRTVAEMPERIGAFRPARIPSKYATKWESEQGARIQQATFQQVSPQHALSFQSQEYQPGSTQLGSTQPQASQPEAFRRTHGDAPEFSFEPELFQPMSSPFAAESVPHQVAPSWDNDAVPDGIHSSGIKQANYSDNVPIPDPFPSSNVMANMPSADSSTTMSAPYQQEVQTVHAVGCECDLCQSHSSLDPGELFHHRRAAIVAARRTTVQLEGLVWWSNSSSLPVLATTNPAGTAVGDAGLLSNATTTSVFTQNAFTEAAPGYRFQIDHDLPGYGGISFEFLQLGTVSENRFASSDQFPILARPFIEASTASDSASVLAFPGLGAGSIQFEMESRFRTAAVHYYQLAIEESSESAEDQFTARFQMGPRIASLREDFWSQDHSFDLINNSSQQRTDSLNVENLFVGGEVGLLLNRQYRRVDLSAGLSVAVGANRQKFQSGGSSVLTEFTGQTVPTDSGWLTSSVSSGGRNRHRFSVIPSAEFGVGFELARGWKLSVGYDVMLWTNALRVTDQISTQLDTRNGAGPGDAIRPFQNLKEDNFLAHGVSFGIERRW